MNLRHHNSGMLVLRFLAAAVPVLGCSADRSYDRESGARSSTAGATATAAVGASQGTAIGVAAPSAGSGSAAIDPNAAAGSNAADDGCPMGRAHVAPIVPTVWLVVDGSSSMNEELTRDVTRWGALRSAVLDPGGIVPELQATVRFGLVIYSGPLRPECNPMAHRDRACGCALGYEDVCCTPTCGAEDTSGIHYCDAEMRIVDPATANGAAVAMTYTPNP